MVAETGGSSGRGEAERCSICLGRISGEGYLDQCFHKFCYHCILQWSEMVVSRPSSTSNRLEYLECPLCKTQYTSIIHDVSGAKFQRHYIFTSRILGLLRSEAHIRRQAVYATYSGHLEPQLSRVTDVVPKPNRWISCWVQRELQALMQEEDVDTVTHHVVGIVESFDKRAKGKAGPSRRQGTKVEDSSWHATISAAVRPFIFEFAERFAVELESFLASGLDIAAYDQRTKLTAPSPVSQSDEENSLPLSNRGIRKTYDLLDGDVEEFASVMVRRTSIETERPLTDESPEAMKQPSREEEESTQELKISKRQSADSRPAKKGSIKRSAKDSADKLDRGRSKHRSDSRKRRKSSRSSSSRSSSPHRHKRQKRDKSVKSRSRKRRDHSRKKVSKSSQEYKRKGHKSRSRKNVHTNSQSSSDSEISRGSRSRSPAERGSRRKAKKRSKGSIRKVENVDSRRMQVLDSEKTRRERRRSPYQYRSSSDEPRKASEKDGHLDVSHRKLRQSRSRHSGAQEAERSGKDVSKGESRSFSDRSSTASPEARMRRRNTFSISPRVSPRRTSGDSAAPPPIPSVSPMNDEDALRWVPSPENYAPSSDLIDEEAKTLETKLREQALANLMRHMSQNKSVPLSTTPENFGENHLGGKESEVLDESAVEPTGTPTVEESPQADQGGRCEEFVQGNQGADLETNLENASKDVKQESVKDTFPDMELTCPLKDDKVGKGYCAESRSSHETIEEANLKGAQPISISYAITAQPVARTDSATLAGESLETESISEKESFQNDGSRSDASPQLRQEDEAGDSERFQQKSMSVTRGGEQVKVSYKVYIPQQTAAVRRRLQR